MTPPPNQTLADSVAPLSADEAFTKDPALQNLKIHFDTGKFGPPVELVHAYFDFWPIVRE